MLQCKIKCSFTNINLPPPPLPAREHSLSWLMCVGSNQKGTRFQAQASGK